MNREDLRDLLGVLGLFLVVSEMESLVGAGLKEESEKNGLASFAGGIWADASVSPA